MKLHWIEKIGIAIIGILMVFVFYLVFVMLPVVLYSEMECAEKGYPKALVMVNLATYCTTLDGAVTVKMDKLP